MTASSTQTPEQREMRRTVAALLDRHAGPERIREAMASGTGYDAGLWRRCTEDLGLAALLVPERCGGLGLDLRDAAVVLEEFGRRLVPSPLATTLVATAVLAGCGTPEADALLERIAEEGPAVSLAQAEEADGWDGERPATAAAAGAGGGLVLRGGKRYVPHGAAVDVLLVVARDADGPALFAVDGDAPGVRRTGRTALDQTRRLAEVDLDDAPAVRLGRPGEGAAAVALAADLWRVVLAVEAAAAAQACLTATVEYLTVREQFGRPLGSFQALKHRCADLAVAVEGAASTAWYAVDAAASASAELPAVAALARVVCGDALMAVAADSLQLHGGVGFTWEYDVHLYLKRGKAVQQLGGSASELRRRFARLAGI
ncbi:acyl-CoA dehydrogenase family protein [Blastococcus sp. SYSU D00820]